MWLIDAYRKGNRIVLWKKNPHNTREELRYAHYFYIDTQAKNKLIQLRVPFKEVKKKNYQGTWIRVLKIKTPSLENHEHYVRRLERLTQYKHSFYNADIAPEIAYLYEHKLRPFSGEAPPLIKCIIELSSKDGYIHHEQAITSIGIDEEIFEGEEQEILRHFVQEFHKKDPDVIIMAYAYRRLPYLIQRLQAHGLHCAFHRWDEEDIEYKGGKSFWSYGQVQYRDYTLQLHGRFLVDTTTQVGSNCDVDSIVEISELTGTPFQTIASRSFGAAFQQGLVRTMIEEGLLIPFKDKPVDTPVSMLDLVKADRYGHTYDPRIGFHTDVAEIDFSSMYPWIIYNQNISADTLLSSSEPRSKAPGIPVHVSYATKGIIPRVIKPIIDRRMHYKAYPTALNKRRIVGLKWLLVTSYGYLRFREFKLGIASAHMSIGAYARKILIDTAHFCEGKHYRVIHGIVDSLYIQKKGVRDDEIKELCKEIELMTGIPVSFEGVFTWIIFLPSINDSDRPVPARYFGALQNGEIKARGIEVRQRSAPPLVKHFQTKALHMMATKKSKKELLDMFPSLISLLKEFLQDLPYVKAEELVCSVRVGTAEYKHTIPQKKIVEKLLSKGVDVKPGMMIQYIYTTRGVVLPSEYTDKVDVEEYTKRMVKALFVLVQVFGVTKEEIEERIGKERQTRLNYKNFPKVDSGNSTSGVSKEGEFTFEET